MSKTIKLKNKVYLDVSSIKQDSILAWLGDNGTVELNGYEQMPLYSKFNLGTCFTIENGMIKVNKSGYYEISGQIHFQSVQSASVKWLEIRDNTDYYISATPIYIDDRSSISVSPTIVYLNANQSIQLKIDAVAGDKIRKDYAYTWIYVKRISSN